MGDRRTGSWGRQMVIYLTLGVTVKEYDGNEFYGGQWVIARNVERGSVVTNRKELEEVILCPRNHMTHIM